MLEPVNMNYNLLLFANFSAFLQKISLFILYKVLNFLLKIIQNILKISQTKFMLTGSKKFNIKDTIKQNTKCEYVYDFGDNWEHDIKLEKVIKELEIKNLPFCLKAVGACPPEDCGGVYGYYDLLDILSDPKHPEYNETKAWIGDNVLQEINLKDINVLLSKI